MDTIPQDTSMKQCNKCKQLFPANTEYFYKQPRGKYGVGSICKSCESLRAKKHNQQPDVREKRIVRQKGWNDTHKEYIREYHKTRRQKPEIREAEARYWQQRREENRELFRQRGREYYASNRERVSAKHKLYYEANKEQNHERSKRYYQNNKEKIAERIRAYRNTEHGREAVRRADKRQRQKESTRERRRQYYRNNKSRITERVKAYRSTEHGREVARNAGRRYMYTEHGRLNRRIITRNRYMKKRSIPGTLTNQQIQYKLRKQHFRCYYAACGHAKFKKENGGYVFHIEHTVPISRTEEHPRNDMSYTVLACPVCNLTKSARLPHEWPEGGRLF